MSEHIQVRCMTATVAVTRDITVVLPVGLSGREALGILGRRDLNEFVHGQPAIIQIDEIVHVWSVDPKDSDLYVIQGKEMSPAGDVEWMEEIEKYAVKTKEPHPEG